ncbi:hypothetical protein [Ulvibacter antarcticus]|uniref:Curlin associated repeat-containing protein n=1 Tax=Ulvibacter antarcticus TaxID=442714 RepID=A0A3L9YAW3_9FLAO|nr:hypothetical protein [Ulvibacter antarcticus]RMA57873.1 hypothetical protein BXY75_2680 [Ulvibacter antarcticus]
MKTIARLLCASLMLFAFTTSYSQTYTDTPSETNSFQSNKAENNYLSTQNYQVQQNGTSRNSVFISQAGNNNSIVSKTSSNSSDINYFQRGNNNDVYVSLSADRIEQNVIQDGDNHSVLNFNNAKLDFHKGEIIQSGNSQNLVWYGDNSISENLKISMQGNGQSVIVRNFN